ncbi:MAG TPA: PD-(D/E)XK nuclease family protein [Terriglobia bacterium]|nr:PD-(D/E)XK nuclease family protein [Terriglobia bacterium]
MPIYSHSQLETYENCPKKYKFKYIDKIRKPLETGIEAFVGSRVHETLRKLYDDLKLKKLNTIEELLAFYQARWKAEWGPGVKIVKEGLAEQNYLDYGESCIRNYYGQYHPFDQSDTLDTEMRLVFGIDPEGKHRVQGFVDRVARRADGVYEIHDYKTARDLPPQSYIDSNRQLALYQIGLRAQWPDVQEVELIWHFVSSKTSLHSHRTPEELEELAQRTTGLIEEIESQTEFKPIKSRLCDWCEYQPDCPIWKHVLAVEKLAPEQFSGDHGVVLANEYASVKSQMDGLDLRLQELRADLESFAEQENVQIIKGNGVQVSVSHTHQLALPAREDPEWTMLQNIIRNNGKWDEVSEVSAPKLREILRSKAWPQPLAAKIQRYLQTRSVLNIRVRSTATGEDNQD